MNLYYNVASGEIIGWGNSINPTVPDGCTILNYDGDTHSINPTKQKIDLTTLMIVAKSNAEQSAAMMPDVAAVQTIVSSQLASTDQFMMPDRGLDAAAVAGWAAYRQALRDISKQPDVRSMIGNWPSRPSGLDAIAGLRSKLAAADALAT